MRTPTLPTTATPSTSTSSHVTQQQLPTKPNSLSMSEVAKRLESLFSRNDNVNVNDPIISTNNDMQHIPSSSSELRKRWIEYQGYRNWEGMLDPLDENLRAEILRYGHFVEAAYESFEFDPSSSSYATCKFPKNKLFHSCGLPNTGYKVTKHLRATSGIQIPRWLQTNKLATQSSYIGYVAVCDNKGEIKRLGRRDVVIAFRGTTTCLEWLENLRANLTDLSPHDNNEGAMVESGFLSLYKSSTPSCISLQQMVRDEIRRILDTYSGDEPLSFTVTGHSLGAALATLTAYDIQTTFNESPMVTVISFGGPRVGNRIFGEQLEKKGTKVLRIVNSDDVITKVPGFVFDDDDNITEMGCHRPRHHHDDDVAGGLPSWIELQKRVAQWVYAEVGKELRLCSRDSPYLNGLNVATCHELNTYLHLVDGFVSSTCPFRATAKRFLRR